MDDKRELLQQLLNDGVKPHAEKIAEICLGGQFACVVFELTKSSTKSLKQAGWDLRRPCFALSPEQVDAFRPLDPASRRWFATPPDGHKAKIFVWTGSGSLLLNFEQGIGYSVENGSLNAQWKN